MEVAAAKERATNLENQMQELVAELTTAREDAKSALMAASVDHTTELKRIQVRNVDFAEMTTSLTYLTPNLSSKGSGV